MQASKPFPAPATVDGYQVISTNCSVVIKTRLVTGALQVALSMVNVNTIGTPLTFSLMYNAQQATNSTLGPRWLHNYMANLSFELSATPPAVTYTDTSGTAYGFVLQNGSWVPDGQSYFLDATLSESDTGWAVSDSDGSLYLFDNNGVLQSISDMRGNQTMLTCQNGLLVLITEPTGRSVQLQYTNGFLTGVMDPNGNLWVLTPDDNGQLIQVVNPAGCVSSFGYDDSNTGNLVSYTDANLNEWSFTLSTDGLNQLQQVQDEDGDTLAYSYDTVNEHMVDDLTQSVALARTTLLDARGFSWDYRFDPSGNFWRIIDPNGHVTRFYWTGQQTLLYTSAGFANPAPDGLYGPRDNFNNMTLKSVYDSSGNILLDVDATGMVTQTTYDANERKTSEYPGRAHLGVQGNWPGQYGSQGYVLAAANADGSDLVSLPSYVSSYTPTGNTPLLLPGAATLMDPRALIVPGGLCRDANLWAASDSQSITVAVNATSGAQFNLSLYTHSLDFAQQDNIPLQYHEATGRDITITVSDANGTQSFRVYNNAGGVWVTFPVTSNGNPILVTVSPSGLTNTSVTVSALAFDAYDSHMTTYAYAGSGDLGTTVDPLGNATTLTYRAPGLLASIIDALGRTTSFLQDQYGNTIQVTDAMTPPGITRMTYDLNGNVLTRTDPNGNVRRFQYDALNRPVLIQEPNGASTSLVYDGAGNVLSITDFYGHATTMTYTDENRMATLTDALGETTQFGWDPAGNLISVTDANLHTTQFSIDPAGNVVTTIRPDLTQVSRAFDALNRVVSVTPPNGALANLPNVILARAQNWLLNPGAETPSPTDATQAFAWQAQPAGPGNVRDTTVSHSGTASFKLSLNQNQNQWVQANVPLPAGTAGVLNYWARSDGSAANNNVYAGVQAFTQNGTTPEISSPSTALPSGSTDWVQTPWFWFQLPGDAQYALAPVSQFVAYANSNSASSVWQDDFQLFSLSNGMTRDAQGRLVKTVAPDGSVVQLVRDRFGRVAQVVDARGYITTIAYDGLDRVVSITDPLGNVTRYVYDAVGNLVTVIDPNGNPTQNVFDNDNRLVAIVYPDTSEETFGYDLASNLTSYTTNNGQTRTMAYDANNRPTLITYSDSTTVVLTWDMVGNLLARVDRNGDLTMLRYDPVYRLVTVERHPSASTAAADLWLQTSTFDPVGNRIQLQNGITTYAVYDTGTYDTSGYANNGTQWVIPPGGLDSMDRMLAYQDSQGNQTNLSYDVEGRVSTILYPNGTPNVETGAGYDIVGNLLSLATTMGSNPLLSLAYSYDPARNRVAMATATDTTTYTLDAAGRLIYEHLNRFVERGPETFQNGQVSQVTFASGALQLTPFAASFSGSLLNVDAWRPVVSPGTYYGLQVQQNDGLSFAYPRAYSNLVANSLPPVYVPYGLTQGLVWAGVEQRNALLSGGCP